MLERDKPAGALSRVVLSVTAGGRVTEERSRIVA